MTEGCHFTSFLLTIFAVKYSEMNVHYSGLEYPGRDIMFQGKQCCSFICHLCTLNLLFSLAFVQCKERKNCSLLSGFVNWYTTSHQLSTLLAWPPHHSPPRRVTLFSSFPVCLSAYLPLSQVCLSLSFRHQWTDSHQIHEKVPMKTDWHANIEKQAQWLRAAIWNTRLCFESRPWVRHVGAKNVGR